MGQEQSTNSLYNSNQYKTKHKEKQEVNHYTKRTHLKQKRSNDSYSSHSSTDSSGYRTESLYHSTSDRSSIDSDYCSIYRNEYYKERNKELYKPVKITKEKRYKLQFLDADKDIVEYLDKQLSVKAYLNENDCADTNNNKTESRGIRNYKPKILYDDDSKKKLDNWI